MAFGLHCYLAPLSRDACLGEKVTFWWPLSVQIGSGDSRQQPERSSITYSPDPDQAGNRFWLYGFAKMISSEGLMHLSLSRNEIRM